MPRVKSAIFTVGRRKTAIARVKLTTGTGALKINKKELENYFSTPSMRYILQASQTLVKKKEKVDIFIRVSGGGLSGQAEACRLGIARALQIQSADTRPELKKAGFLRRDSRMVERKKYGLRKARRGTQFSKR